MPKAKPTATKRLFSSQKGRSQFASRFKFDDLLLVHEDEIESLLNRPSYRSYIRDRRSYVDGVRPATKQLPESREYIGYIEYRLFEGDRTGDILGLMAGAAEAAGPDAMRTANAIYGPGGALEENAPIPLWDGLNAIEIRELCVYPPYRGFGLGRMLISAAIDRYRTFNLQVAIVRIDASSAVPKDDPLAKVSPVKATRQLERYFSSMQFDPLPGHPLYMVLNLHIGMY